MTEVNNYYIGDMEDEYLVDFEYQFSMDDDYDGNILGWIMEDLTILSVYEMIDNPEKYKDDDIRKEYHRKSKTYYYYKKMDDFSHIEDDLMKSIKKNFDYYQYEKDLIPEDAPRSCQWWKRSRVHW